MQFLVDLGAWAFCDLIFYNHITCQKRYYTSQQSENEENQSDGAEHCIFALAQRKRKVTFEGIEIYTSYGTGAQKDSLHSL